MKDTEGKRKRGARDEKEKKRGDTSGSLHPEPQNHNDVSNTYVHPQTLWGLLHPGI